MNNKLKNFLETGRIPHGLLFIGESNELMSAAAELSKTMLCEKSNTEACGECPPCKKVQNSVHPDIIYVKNRMPDEKYKIEALRHIISEGSIRPNDGDLKIFIFSDVSTMTALCQNTLLKFIEEPLPFNRFIFLSETTSGILETVLSRLVRVDFGSEKKYGDDYTEIIPVLEAVVNALVNKNEYKAAAAFSGISDRNKMSMLLKLLSEVFRDSLMYKNDVAYPQSLYKKGAENLSKTAGTKNILQASELISEYLNQTDFNPNVKLSAAIYAGGIFTAIIENK